MFSQQAPVVKCNDNDNNYGNNNNENNNNDDTNNDHNKNNKKFNNKSALVFLTVGCIRKYQNVSVFIFFLQLFSQRVCAQVCSKLSYSC